MAVLLLTACDNTTPPPITPSYALSAPTLEASAVVYPSLPTLEPTDLAFIGQNDPTAAALPSGGDLPPILAGSPAPLGLQPIEIPAPDGTLLGGDLAQDPLGTAYPAVLLLAPNRAGWGNLPLQIQRAGFIVLSMDIRPDAGSEVALGDVGAMVTGLSQLQSIDSSRIAIIGSGIGADLALAACGGGVPCDAMALFSPQTAAQQAIFAFNPRPLFLAVGSDAPDFLTTEALRAAAQGEVAYQAIAGESSGTALLQADPNLGASLIAWLEDWAG